jgi:uncharacterized OsmC-like protein
MATVLNGWDVDAMNEAVEGVKEEPESGRLTWRSRVRWDRGFGLDVRTREIEQLGDVVERPFTLRGDHPPELLGGNTGPTAIELLMGALGSCMAGTFAAQATARGVEVESLEVDVSADMDLNGFFGLQPVDAGVSDVDLVFRVRADASPEVLQEIADAARAHSPVFDSVTRPVGVETAVRKV